MKTIEERPIEPYCFETDREEQWYSVGKWDGATEQKQIDDKVAFEEREKAFKAGYDTAIKTACEIYEKDLRQMKRILNQVKKGAGELISVGGSLIQFRKEMEE